MQTESSLSRRFPRSVIGVTLCYLAIASACAPREAPPETSSSPVPAGPDDRVALCEPFPDRLIDEFLTAYKARDEAALSDLVQVERIRDISAVAYAGRAEFGSVGEWAHRAWEAHDEIRLAGYSAFEGSSDGFTMYGLRRNDALAKAGISEAFFMLHARSTGCVIDELGSVGQVRARGQPCRFYNAFGSHPAVTAEAPPGCVDGTGVFARMGHDAVWTGQEMIVAGGSRGWEFYPPDVPEEGLRYRPEQDGWLPTSKAPVGVRPLSQAVWTGREVLLWRGSDDEAVDVAAYDPATNDWKRLPPWPLQEFDHPAGVWTGSELLLWGSSMHTDSPTRYGAAYDPATNTWRRTSAAPIAGREGHSAVWSGREMIVWGGSNFRTELRDGAAYDPATGRWRTIAPGPLQPRQEHVAVWTGREMLVWGGSSNSSSKANGAAYDPVTDTWRELASAPIKGRHRTEGVWTGEWLLIWGGYDDHDPLGDGAAYDPAQDEWILLPEAPISPRCDHSAVWTGQALLIFGGYNACGSGGHIPFGDGAAYEPVTGVWTRLEPSR
jgi:hypothetical protein